MTYHLLSIVVLNGLSGVILIKYLCDYIHMKLVDNDKRTDLLLTKVQELVMDVNELNKTIDTLENKLQERIQEKENKLKQSSDLLFQKIDELITSNYDTIQA